MTDGNIQAAKTRLADAIHRLTAPRTCIHYGHTLTAPSLYTMLATNLSASQGDTRTPAKSLPPLWIDAEQLLIEIDTQTRTWQQHWKTPTHPKPTERLTELDAHGWRPQDSRDVNHIAGRINSWCETIIGLFNPEARKYIHTPCPHCGRKTVYRRDSAGEIVRQPALVLVTAIGCTCQACDAHWTPDKYLFLCRLLGFDLPEGVLE